MSRILVVEDEVDVAEVLRDALEGLGHGVVVASDGAEGLKKALRDPPDLIITDLMMPVLDGKAMIERLRADERTEQVPIIVVSAADASVREPFLRKPFALGELFERMRSMGFSAGR